MKIIMVSVMLLLVSCSDGKGISTTGYGRNPQIIGDDSFRADVLRAMSKLEPGDYAYLSGIHKGHEPTCRTQSIRRGYRVDGYYDSGTGKAGICRSGRKTVERMAEIIEHENRVHAKCEWKGEGINSDHSKEC